MRNRKLYFRQILAGILSVILAVETPIYALADSIPSDISTNTAKETSMSEEGSSDEISEDEIVDEAIAVSEGMDDLSFSEDILIDDGLPENGELTEDILSEENEWNILSDNSVSGNELSDEEISDEKEVLMEEDMYSAESDNDGEDMPAEVGYYGWHELTGYRSENVKVYEKPDHSITAFCYAEPVNYRDSSGVWKTIDNRLHYSRKATGNMSDMAVYVNNSAPFDIEFVETADEDNLFSLSEDGLAVSFVYCPKDISVQKEEELLQENHEAAQADPKERGAEYDNNAIGGEKWRRKAILSKTETEIMPENADILAGDDTSNVSADEDGEGSYPMLPVPQTVLYDSVDKGASLEYIPTGDGVKETIVINSAEAPAVYMFRMDLKGMTAFLSEGNIILSKTSGEMVYEIPAPVAEDAKGNNNCEAHYELKNTGSGSYELKVVIDGEWLKGQGRAFPVRIDPTVKKYRRFSSLEPLGDFVSICSDGTKDNEKLQVGHTVKRENGKNKAVTYRTYMNPILPEIDKGSVVTDAKLRLSAGEASKIFYALPVPGKWDADKIKANNQPFKGTSLKKSLKEISDYGKNGTVVLDVTKDVKAIAEGRKQAYGWCFVSEDEKAKSVRTVAPYKGTDKPFLEITYKDLTGTEKYYSVHRQTAGNAGIGSINDFTGRLTFVHTDATSVGERMPLSVSHIYDIAYGERMGEEKWQASEGNDGGYGRHFRLSTDVRLLVPAGETDIKTYPYVYIDADGTKHYFKAANVSYYVNGTSKLIDKKNDGTYPSAKDEDGLGLFVVPVTEGTLKDTYPLKIVNKSGSLSMYFDKSGYPWKIADSNLREDGKNGMNTGSKEKKQENAITITYEKGSRDSSSELDRLKKITEEVKTVYDKDADTDEMIDRAFKCIGRLEEFEKESLNASTRYKTALHIQRAIDSLAKLPDGDKKENYKKDADNAVKELTEAQKDSFDASSKRPVRITDASGETAELKYDDGGMLISMSDPYEGGAFIRYEYDTLGRLVSIVHPNGTYGRYSYDKYGHLTRAVDEMGNRIDYSYGKKKQINDQVTKITEYIGNRAGQTVLIGYDDINTTVYTYSGRDEKTGNGDDIENVYCFDDKGRTTSAYSRKKKTKEAIGGTLRAYTDDDTDTTSYANKVKEEAITGAQIVNLITDGSFEKNKSKNGDEAWEIFNTCEDPKNCHTVKKDGSQKYMGSRSAYVKLKQGHLGMAGFRQTVKVPETGMYTASVYVHSKNLKDANAKLKINTKKKNVQTEESRDSEDEGSEESGEGDDGLSDGSGSTEDGSNTEEAGRVDYDTLPDINNGWKRVEATIKANKGDDITVSISLEGTSGEVWFDCVQLEKGSLANQYNLIPNSGFEDGYRINPNLTEMPSGWAYGAEAVKEGESVTDDEGGFPDEEDDRESDADADTSCIKIVTAKETGITAVEGKRALMIKGNPIKRRSVIVNPNFGNDKASYTFSCYVKADCAPVPVKDSKRKCGIYIRGNKAGYNEDDANGKYMSLSGSDEAKALINTQVPGWQYVSIALPVKNWYGRLIELRFDYEIGTLCIDGCMLTKNEVQTKTYTASGKLKTEQKGEQTKTYETDGRSRRKKETLPGGASISYTYDNVTNDVKSEKYSFKQPGKDNANSLTTKYTYDEYGNVSKISETAGGVSGEIKTETVYDDKGRFAISDTDSRGNTTESRYDENNGLLLGMTDVLNIETEYTYNGYHDPTGINSAGVNVSYAYDKKFHDRLKTIKAGDADTGEAYTFAYDAYGNVKAVTRSGSDKRLISYAYMSNNGKLKQKAYGNGNKASYKYNELEQLISESYGGKDVISYEYDNRGNTARITDRKEGLKYRYYYDDKGRIITGEVCKLDGREYKEDIFLQSIYDKAGRQSVFAYHTGGHSYRTEYGYTSDDKAAAATLPSGGVFRRTYDGFDRITKDEFTPQKKPETGEKKARGSGAAVSSTYSYLDTDRGEDGSKTKYTTRLISKLDTTVGTGKNKKTAVTDTLSYDKAGRIDSFNGIVYTYDELGRLIKAEDKNNDRIWEYSYDSSGNLTGSSYTEKGEKKEETYGYRKGNLTEFGGGKIKNYRGGNPGTYLGNTLKWARGRQLKSIKAGRKSDKVSAEYTYAYDGSRLSKTVGNSRKDQIKTEYVLNGSMILQERIMSSGADVQTEVLNYYYSPDGKLLEIGYKKGDEKENHYSVIRNAMGDVTALYTAEGTLVGTYEYDPYGKLLAQTPNEAYDDTDGILAKNPFRYRGYYYDRETGWYYLQSRYYDPEVKRFINADSTDLLTNDCMNLMQYNLFMYCNGDPVNGFDPSGHVDILDYYLVIMCIQSLVTGNSLPTEMETENESRIAITTGASANLSIGFVYSTSLQLYKDQYGTVALQFTYGDGVGGGAGITFGPFAAFYPHIIGIEETEKFGVTTGGSGGYLGELGIDLISGGEGDNIHPIGGSIGVYGGAGAEGHVVMLYTNTIFRFNIFEQINRFNKYIGR